jgi:hypothetical protein
MILIPPPGALDFQSLRKVATSGLFLFIAVNLQASIFQSSFSTGYSLLILTDLIYSV